MSGGFSGQEGSRVRGGGLREGRGPRGDNDTYMIRPSRLHRARPKKTVKNYNSELNLWCVLPVGHSLQQVRFVSLKAERPLPSIK